MRPKDANSEQTIAQILGAARTLLEEGGPQGLSLRGVARHAGMSVGSVSYYFESLEALTEACLDLHYARSQALAQTYLAELAAGKPLCEVSRAAARAFYFFALEERAFLRLQLATSAQRGGLPERRRLGDQRLVLKTALEHIGGVAELEHPMLAIQSLVYSVTRFACASPEERCAFAGTESEAEADEIIGDFIGALASKVLTQ